MYYVYPKVLRNIFLEKNRDPGGMMTAWIAVLPIKIAPKWVNITKYSLQKTPWEVAAMAAVAYSRKPQATSKMTNTAA